MGTHWIDLYANNNCMTTFQKKSNNLFYKFHNFYKLIPATQLIFEKNAKLILNHFLKENISTNEPHVYDTKPIYLQSDNGLQYRVS